MCVMLAQSTPISLHKLASQRLRMDVSLDIIYNNIIVCQRLAAYQHTNKSTAIYYISFTDCNQRGAGSSAGVDSGTLCFINGNLPTDPTEAPKSPPAEKARQCVFIWRRTEVDRSSNKIRKHTVGIQHSERLTSNQLLRIQSFKNVKLD